MKKIVYEVRLSGIYSFYVSSKISIDIDNIIQNYERERGKYGFSYIKNKNKQKIVNDFMEKHPQLILEYRTWIELELHKRMRNIKWLHLVLLRSGFQVTYQSVALWVRGAAVPKVEVQKKLEQLFLVN